MCLVDIINYGGVTDFQKHVYIVLSVMRQTKSGLHI